MWADHYRAMSTEVDRGKKTAHVLEELLPRTAEPLPACHRVNPRCWMRVSPKADSGGGSAGEGPEVGGSTGANQIQVVVCRPTRKGC